MWGSEKTERRDRLLVIGRNEGKGGGRLGKEPSPKPALKIWLLLNIREGKTECDVLEGFFRRGEKEGHS